MPEDAYVNSIAVDSESGTTLLAGTVHHGIYRRTESLSAIEPEGVSERVLVKVSPSPFTGEAVVQYRISAPCYTSVTVHDVCGRQVATLVSRTESAGAHRTVWNGRNTDGEQVSPGVYFVTVKTDEVRAVTTIVRVK